MSTIIKILKGALVIVGCFVAVFIVYSVMVEFVVQMTKS